MAVELKVPEVGESITEVQIGEWLKNEGDHVERDEVICMIETDKVTVELPAPVSGTISKISVKQGEEASVGDVIGYMEEGEGASKKKGGGDSGKAKGGDDDEKAATKHRDDEDDEKSSKSDEEEDDEKKRGDEEDGEEDEKVSEREQGSDAKRKKTADDDEESKQKGDDDEEEPDSTRSSLPPQAFARVMPSARRVLRERGLRAEQVKGTGPGGRILKEDVERHVRQAKAERPRAKAKPPSDKAPPQPKAESEAGREEEVVAMTPMRRRIAERLVQSQQAAALLTTFNEIDMSEVMALRKQYQPQFKEKYGIKLGFMSFFVKAAIEALKLIPQVNAEIRDDSIVYKNYYDIGVAVGGGKGLVVPVIRGAERLSFAEVEQTISDYAERAQANKLKLDELQGGTFTISNGGVYGSLLSTPIVNPPQSGILGLHAIMDRPMARDGQVVIRPMMYVALTYDHRIVDGREAVTFLKRIKECIEDPSRILLEV